MKVAKTLSVGRVLVLKSVGDVTDVVGVVLANNMRDKSLTVFVLADQRLEEGSAQKVKKNLQPNIDFEVVCIIILIKNMMMIIFLLKIMFSDKLLFFKILFSFT